MTVALKERTESHVCTYFARTRDPEIQARIPQSAETVEQAVADFEKTLLPGATSFGNTIYVDGSYVGDIWCYCIDPEEEPNAMVSYCLFEKEFWNKGVCTEALRQFELEIVPRFGLKSLGAFTYCDNISSIRVLEKNGFAKMEEFTEAGRLSVYCQKEINA
jgi:RimJ/RimL family protein N-acetyltransferase